MNESNESIILELYELLSPENRERLLALLEEAVRSQSASPDSH